MDVEFYTIGVFGLTESLFFDKLTNNQIDTFIDIRRRRAVRGSKYSFVNSTKLQERLKSLGLKYIHILELAPSKEIRNIQKKSDLTEGVLKTNRTMLSNEFIAEYKQQVLDKYDFSNLFNLLAGINSHKAVLFCVEKEPAACHRSLVGERLKQSYFKHLIDL